MIDPTIAIDLVVTAALKAASSEVVKRSIGALSGRLGAAIENRNHAEAKKIIEEENLIEPIAKIAQEGIEKSVIFSLNETDLSSPTYKTELFNRVLDLGFRASTENKVDILLTGSLINSETLSVFSTRSSVPLLTKSGISITIAKGLTPTLAFYAILPDTGRNSEVVDDYKAKIKDIRNESLSSYIQAGQIAAKESWAYSLKQITAGSVYFDYSSNAKQVSSIAEADRVAINDFSKGIRQMLNDIKDYPSIPRLSDRERYEIDSLLEEIKNVGI